MNRDLALSQIENLIDIFKTHLIQYKQISYKEAQVRKEFIDKFFISLDWDVNNDEGRAEKYKEVINEDSIKIAGKSKAPDYAFRIGGSKVFYVEAKKPYLNIKDDPEPAFQLRRYAWNSKIPLSVLTDFHEFSIYDCTIKPNPNDSSNTGRIFYCLYEDYIKNFDYIWNIFSKVSVLKGSFDKFVNSTKEKKGTQEVDSEFLKEIENWRVNLTKNIIFRNPINSITNLNQIIQKIIDRILFLRICEDKNMEQYEMLKELSKTKNVYDSLLDYFKRANDKYNSGIFSFDDENTTDSLIIDNKVLIDIINNLYYPRSPYDFSVLTIEILGKVYEKFLSKKIVLTSSKRIKIEEKKIVRQRSGVYYTPEYIVNYIVKNTLDPIIQNKTPEEIQKIKILNPACGSGTFLVSAYSYLLEYHLNYYRGNLKKYKNKVYQVKEEQWYLTTEVRKKILLNNIFGVDIDPQAVEITKLSLLLKVLENETKESINQQLKLFEDRALPNIDNNIKCGNSIVDYSYLSQKTLTDNFNKEEIMKINPFDWNDVVNGFGNILKAGGFDVIIGNPPYVKEDMNREIFDPVKNSNMSKYYQGKIDYWYLFTCKSIDLLRKNGLHSFIAQNNWITSDGASILRNKILTDTKILSYFDFNEFKVFDNAGIQTMIFILEKDKLSSSYPLNYYKITNKNITKEQIIAFFAEENDFANIEKYIIEFNNNNFINKSISFENQTTNTLTELILSKANRFLTDYEIGNGIDVLQDFVTKKHLEKLKGTTIKKGDGVFVLNQDEFKNLNLSEFELKKVLPYYTSVQLEEYYGNPKNNYWIIYSDKDVRTRINLYPNIKKHLIKFKKITTSAFKPYGLHRPREQRFFEGEKILVLRKTKKMSCTYTDFPCYVSRAYLIIKPKDINPKYLTGILNSKMINYYIYHRGKRQGEQLQIDKFPLMNLPIYLPDGKNSGDIKKYENVIKYIELIMENKKKILESSIHQEKNLLRKYIEIQKNNIDELVYELYRIPMDKRQIIENWYLKHSSKNESMIDV